MPRPNNAMPDFLFGVNCNDNNREVTERCTYGWFCRYDPVHFIGMKQSYDKIEVVFISGFLFGSVANMAKYLFGMHPFFSLINKIKMNFHTTDLFWGQSISWLVINIFILEESTWYHSQIILPSFIQTLLVSSNMKPYFNFLVNGSQFIFYNPH